MAPHVGVGPLHRRPPLFWLDVVVKLALVALLLYAVARPDLPQFQGKAVVGRALTYPIAALIVPLIWFVRGRRGCYPYDIDILVVLPFLIDTAGNALNMYDTISWWDDANHFVNWGILVTGFGCLLVRLPLGRLNAFALAVGFGCVTAVLWEFGEYLTFIRNNKNELRTAYTDTLGDLALGGGGSVLAAVLTVTLLWRRRPDAVVGAS